MEFEKKVRYTWLLLVTLFSFVFTLSYNSYSGFDFYGENTIIKLLANQLFLLPSPLNLVFLIITMLFHPIVILFAWRYRVFGGKLIGRVLTLFSTINRNV